jgi:hypothetical protein
MICARGLTRDHPRSVFSPNVGDARWASSLCRFPKIRRVMMARCAEVWEPQRTTFFEALSRHHAMRQKAHARPRTIPPHAHSDNGSGPPAPGPPASPTSNQHVGLKSGTLLLETLTRPVTLIVDHQPEARCTPVSLQGVPHACACRSNIAM